MRALLKNPPILMLDEATSALDVATGRGRPGASPVAYRSL
jgi:ABC-type iron transport system FetAB ATPase subunit